MERDKPGKERPLAFRCFRLQNAFGRVPLTDIDLQKPKQMSDAPSS